MENIDAQTLISITSGEYSDFGLLGIFRTKIKFNPDEVMKEFLKLNLTEGGGFYTFAKFLKWITVDKKYVEEIQHINWHLGDYGTGDDGHYLTRTEDE